MKREELLRSKEYWIVQIQNKLFSIIEEYMKNNDLNRTELAQKFGVTKGYITQVLKGDFDHKISKMVDLALSSGQIPLLNFVDINSFIKNDSENKTYELIPINRPRLITFDKGQPPIIKMQPDDNVDIDLPVFTTDKSEETLSFDQNNKKNLPLELNYTAA